MQKNQGDHRSRQISSAQKTWPSSVDFSNKKGPGGILARHIAGNTEFGIVRKIAPQIHRSWNVQLTSRTNIRDCGDKSGEEIALSGGAVSVSGRRCTEGGDQGGDQARGEMESCDNCEEVLDTFRV